MVGRPTTYTNEIGELICQMTASSNKSLHNICDEINVPYSSACEWIYNKDHELSGKYARAKLLQADYLAGEIIAISDNDTKDVIMGEFGEQGNPTAVNRDKLKIDARKWRAAKLAPKIYGDKIDVTTDGEKVTNPVTGEALLNLANKINA